MPSNCTFCLHDLFSGRRHALVFLFLFASVFLNAQTPVVNATRSTLPALRGPGAGFIENIGQYGRQYSGKEEFGEIKFGYEGFGMPVLFTPTGFLHLQRKVSGITHDEEERLEKEGVSEEEIERKKEVVDKVLTFEWVAANPSPRILFEEPTTAYHTYGLIQGKARGYGRIIFQELYPGIDLILSSTPNQEKAGFEFSFHIKPGADPAQIRIRTGGDIVNEELDASGGWKLESAIGDWFATRPQAFFYNKENRTTGASIAAHFKRHGKDMVFSFPEGFDRTKDWVIDPFVGTTANLSGLNAGKAKDVDFDYAGNIYVTGGGSFTGTHQLAKYDAGGNLLWTFNGSITLPAWSYGTYFGGWMVEKPTGHVYLGQGFSPGTGFRVVRINTNGLFDNYITAPNPTFMEAWKMFWSCNNGSPQILIAGGGLNSNINFGAFTPPGTAVNPVNITGIPFAGGTGWAQDISDFVFDPVTNDMYSIFGSTFGTPSVDNKIYKNTAPYGAASVAWTVPSGYLTIQEAANRPYLVAGGLSDNSANMLWVNASYLYYWDGKNLKAFNKANGTTVGTPVVTGNAPFAQGGIIADACNNVFIGEANGLIKVYQFNGTNFNDAPADITIPGMSGHAVYDLAYDESRKLLYVSGDGFVASVDVSAYCPTTFYTLTTVPNCATSGMTASVSPAPPLGSSVTYTLFNGSTTVATNSTGVFAGLLPNVTYTVVATINQFCNGVQTSANFLLPGPTIQTINTAPACGINSGQITATATGTTGPYTFSLNGGAFQASGAFTGLSGGVYIVTAQDANGCKDTSMVVLTNPGGPQFILQPVGATCGNNNGNVTILATGGLPPYSYSMNGSVYQANPFFTGLTGGSYTVYVKDAAGCVNSLPLFLTSSTAPQITAVPAAATCGSSNGNITAFGTGGTAPLSYSIDGNNFQSSNFFNNLTPGTYIVRVKDVTGCMATVTVILPNSPAPTITATTTAASCNNVNGSITVTGSGGLAPLQYSIDGVNFQALNIFTGLAAGSYTLIVKDASGCTNLIAVTVGTSNAPVVIGTATASSCSANTGIILAAASGGTPGYTYSINGVNFQAGTSFTGLAPGTYILYVRDITGCIGTTVVVVPALAGPSISASSTATSCSSNTGTITANGTGGTAPLQYSLDGTNYQAGNVFTNLAAGNYTVYVRDANGCIRSVNLTLSNVSGLTLAASSLASNCSSNTGIITATTTGGIAPLQYSLDGVTYQASNQFANIPSGTYTVYVKDANNCIVSTSVIVTAIAGPNLTITTLHQPSCGGSNGAIRANGTDGVAPLTYSLDGGAFQAVAFFINLSSGLHTVIVKDANGCQSTQTVNLVNVGAGTPPTDVTFRVVDGLPCTGQLGRIKNLKGEPGGGGNSYEFSLDGGAFTNSNQFTNVAPGVHSVTARNEDGCTITKLVTIGLANQATATVTATPANCGSTNGTITVVGVGTNTPYHVSVDNGASWVTFFPPGTNSQTFTGFAPGTYQVMIADDATFVAGPPDDPGDCINTINVVVPSIGGPSIATSQINPSCNAATGSIIATASGGVAPYSFSLNGGGFQSSGTFNNLTPGIYAVSVQDGSGCINGVNITLTGQALPTVTATILSAACGLTNGSITATGTGGVAPLEYSLNGTVFQSSNLFTGLAPGVYTLYVKDVNNCYSSISVTILNTLLPRVTAYTIPASCNVADGAIVATGTLGSTPYTYSLDGTQYQTSGNFSGLSAGFYTIYIKDSRGCINTTGVTISNLSGPVISNAVSTPANCGNPTGTITVTATSLALPLEYSLDGIVFQSLNQFTGLIPGLYTVTVRDALGCRATRVVTLLSTNGPQTLTATVINAACGLSNGTITATATGGVGALQYSINGTVYQASTAFSGLPAGIYTLYVRDANGCIRTLPVTITNLAGPSLLASSTPASCGLSDGTITAQATGGTAPLSYSLNGTVFQSSNIFLGLATGTYTVTVRDNRNCTQTYTLSVGSVGAVLPPLIITHN